MATAAAGIAGTGNLAQALGRALIGRGVRVGWVAGRDCERTRQAARWIGAGVEAVTFAELAQRARRIVIVVADGAIGTVAAQLAAAAPAAAEGVTLHCCGGMDAGVLAPLRARGFACGTLHPLQTICSPEQGAAALAGAALAVGGDAAALAWTRELAAALGGRVLEIRPGAQAAYHAAAVMASNYVAALLDAAQTLLAGAADTSTEAARAALAPLVRASVDNVLERGPEAALTGPIARGDRATVALHLEALGAAPAPLRALYRAAGLQALEVARRKGLGAEEAAAIARLLKGIEATDDQTG